MTAAWAFVLLRRTPTWQPWLAWTVLALGVVAAVGLLLVGPRLPRVLGAARARGGAWRPGWPGRPAYASRRPRRRTPARSRPPGRRCRAACGPGGGAGGGSAAAAGRRRAARAAAAGGGTAQLRHRRPAGPGGGRRRRWRGGPGGFGGLLGSPTPSTQVVALLQRDAGDYTWAAAAVGSNNAAGYQLATRLPVMAVGGFNGTDPSPTLAQFQQLVADGKIH